MEKIKNFLEKGFSKNGKKYKKNQTPQEILLDSMSFEEHKEAIGRVDKERSKKV